MRESDSNTYPHGFSPDSHAPDPAPSRHPQTLVHRAFVPIILSLVVAIVSFSTFRHDDAISPAASNSPDRDDRLDPRGTTTVLNPANTTSPLSDPGGTVFETAAAETDAADSSPLPGNRGPDNAYPQVPPPPHARPVMHPPAYVDLLEQQRRAHHEAMLAHQQHRARIRAHRASIQRRLQQDRETVYRRMQEIEQRAWHGEVQRTDRMPPAEKLAAY